MYTEKVYYKLSEANLPIRFYNRGSEKPCGPGSLIKRGDGGQAIAPEADFAFFEAEKFVEQRCQGGRSGNLI